MQELATKQAMAECGYCTEREKKLKEYEEEIEREKVRECQKALEREKIAKGMQCSRKDEIQLRELQKMQMEERRQIQEELQQIDNLWHRVLVEDVRRKEQKEREDFERHQREMADRRGAYDEQIASANRKRQEMIRQEREKENRKLERMRKKMEQDHYEAIKRKKEQQMTNKTNFIEGHKEKVTRLQNQKRKERDIDNGTIRVALDGLRKERQREREQMHRLQMEKQVFTECYNRERRMDLKLEEDADTIAHEWKREEESKADEVYRQREALKRMSKEQAAEEYRRHIEQRNQELEREKQNRTLQMERVKRTAVKELQYRLDSANVELRRQLDYRHSLTNQIRENQRVMETELQDMEVKQRPFTKKAEMFKDKMEKIDKAPGRESTNPVHPFMRVIEKRQMEARNALYLPLIGKSGLRARISTLDRGGPSDTRSRASRQEGPKKSTDDMESKLDIDN